MAVQVSGDSRQTFSFGPEAEDKLNGLLLFGNPHQLSVNDAVAVRRDPDMGADRSCGGVAETAVRWAQVHAAADQGLAEGGLRDSKLLGNLS